MGTDFMLSIKSIWGQTADPQTTKLKEETGEIPGNLRIGDEFLHKMLKAQFMKEGKWSVALY